MQSQLDSIIHHYVKKHFFKWLVCNNLSSCTLSKANIHRGTNKAPSLETNGPINKLLRKTANKSHLPKLLIHFLNLKKSTAEAYRLLVEPALSCVEWFYQYKVNLTSKTNKVFDSCQTQESLGMIQKYMN